MPLLPPEKREELCINAVLKEIADADSSMRELLLSADRAIAGTALFLVTSVTLVLTKHLPEVLIIIPYATTATFFFMLQKFIDRQIHAGTRRWLEEAVNARLGQAVCQRMKIGKALPRPDERGAAIVYGAGALLTVASSVIGILLYTPPKPIEFLRYLWPLHLVGVSICAWLLFVVVVRMSSAEEDAYIEAKDSRLDLTLLP